MGKVEVKALGASFSHFFEKGAFAFPFSNDCRPAADVDEICKKNFLLFGAIAKLRTDRDAFVFDS